MRSRARHPITANSHAAHRLPTITPKGVSLRLRPSRHRCASSAILPPRRLLQHPRAHVRSEPGATCRTERPTALRREHLRSHRQVSCYRAARLLTTFRARRPQLWFGRPRERAFSAQVSSRSPHRLSHLTFAKMPAGSCAAKTGVTSGRRLGCYKFFAAVADISRGSLQQCSG